MAPSGIPVETGPNRGNSGGGVAVAIGPLGSRFLQSSTSPTLSSSAPLSSSSSPVSSPPSSSKNSKERKRGTDDRSGGAVNGEIPVRDSPIDSAEEIYWSNHPHSQEGEREEDSEPDNNGLENHDNNRHGDSGELESEEHQEKQPPHYPQRRPHIRSSARYSNDNSDNGSPIKEVKYAKAGILSPNNAIIDRGGGGGGGTGNGGDMLGQILPGETLYLAQNHPGNRPSGQYQVQPGYNGAGNGVNGNGNYINGNGGGYGSHNGASSPQPHPYNGNGHPPYPFLHYPQAQPGGGQAYPGMPHYYDPHGQFVLTSNSTSGTGLNVRGEEVGIVLVVLLLWVGAIILFFNRWGKIRMLEPYQPKFCENHRPSCPMAEVTAITNIPVCRERTFSKYNISTEMLAGPNGSPHFVKCNYHGVPSADPVPGFSGVGTSGLPGGLTIPGAGFPGGGSTGMLNSRRNSTMMTNHHHYLQHHHHQHHHHLRPRQNSVFVTSPSSQVSLYGSDTTLRSSSRKTKSAVDLPTLVLTGEFIDNVKRNSKSSITQL